MYSGDQRTLYLDEAIHRRTFRDFRAVSHMELDVHAQWPFLLNTPPRAFLQSRELPLSHLESASSQWLLRECERSGSPTNLALSFQLPGWHQDPRQQYTEIQIQKLRSVYQSPIALQRYIDYMVKEIQILRGILSEEIRLSYMHWDGDLVHFLSDSELTQLMFFINRAFSGVNSPSTQLVAELDTPPKSDDLLALLVGLGINTVCINDPGITNFGFPLSELKDWIKLIRNYGISKVLLRLYLAEEISDDLSSNLADIISAAPDAVLLLRPSSVANGEVAGVPDDQIFSIKQDLLEALYSPMTDSFYVSQNWNSTTSHLVKGIGLGAKSYTSNLEFYNTHGLTEYYQILDSGKLPIKRVQKLITELY
ncbi:hypothetical protein BTA51_16350 [Hahella sp. CCB-MM4]|uniref:hypothetical protein n=1 Tax=Hahella sp. (strain CCB-MM4) TaxID=1926491 RepID=UPI000B9A466D|nr:hypothetical protein [Hahella sp. CCB-MM4]OZG72308.1 hypothetical protein BTA51_16350 [Hahella sp. CCB-MM4]